MVNAPAMTQPPHFPRWPFPSPTGIPLVPHLGQLGPPDPAVGRVEMALSDVDVDGYSIYRYSLGNSPKQLITDPTQRGLSSQQRYLISGLVAPVFMIMGYFAAQFVGTSVGAFLFGALLSGAAGFGLAFYFTSSRRLPDQSGANAYVGDLGVSMVWLRNPRERGMEQKSLDERLARASVRYDGPERWRHSRDLYKGESGSTEFELLVFRGVDGKDVYSLGSSSGSTRDDLVVVRRALSLMLAARVPIARAAMEAGRELDFPHYPDILAEFDGNGRPGRLVIRQGTLTREVDGRVEHSIALADLSATMEKGSFIFRSRSGPTQLEVPYGDVGDGAVLAVLLGI